MTATVCVHCGHKEADAQTGRCLGCGRRIISPNLVADFRHPVLDRNLGVERHSPSTAYRSNGSPTAEEPPAPPAAEPAPAPTPISADVQVADTKAELRQSFEAQPLATFVLPDSRETSSWLAKTRAVRDQLLARADKADTQAKELATEADRCRQTASAFASLLSRLSAAGAEAESPPPTERQRPGPKAQWGTWSKNFDQCIDCGRSDVPHCANGRCRSCDGKWRNARKGS